jgi:hypothetical protein
VEEPRLDVAGADDVEGVDDVVEPEQTLRCPAGRGRPADQATSSPRPILEGTVAREEPHSSLTSSGRKLCREHPRTRRDRQRASRRSSRSASPRTLRKCKPRSGSSGACRRRLCCSRAVPLSVLSAVVVIIAIKRPIWAQSGGLTTRCRVERRSGRGPTGHVYHQTR